MSIAEGKGASSVRDRETGERRGQRGAQGDADLPPLHLVTSSTEIFRRYGLLSAKGTRPWRLASPDPAITLLSVRLLPAAPAFCASTAQPSLALRSIFVAAGAGSDGPAHEHRCAVSFEARSGDCGWARISKGEGRGTGEARGVGVSSTEGSDVEEEEEAGEVGGRMGGR